MTTATASLKPNDYLKRRDAAEYLGVSFNTLTCWASEKKGPPFYKPGKHCLYKVAELDAFRESRRVAFEHVPL
ncbi:TPA: helix-turn-helix domain-containing protein [Pseudomonas aeruginosa]|jgi:excisionase family DNA binding protein|uniref:helix-turn-helix domain-containing protein n=1 Tax=Pseudomonas aeruginosa TaxID=287 RepID=UPI002A6B80C9|nr:helix-turn-helix domain-containing protein [Pseudomonas aeruginosa]MDY1289843.1 helix-turn-helix domain-containing protein [Pseudomonas aeruginosa]HCF4553571.1 helix-turn-helix domain-containing protein [Pseudomonas aeruginosa]HCF4625445.1 helix-turn-helix domain-containing protein [Pseudomonas aeruginosa]HCF4652426.1 helix-turn-helix domain-containing protein [Pseudomonas aeruginosa]HCL3265159.1 helix-turn-helix domain-containing protein [Pseudomonas aeruginosa]